MTKILFFTENGMLSGVHVYGHSGYADEGSDIVCAAVTSALRLCECELTEVLKLRTSVKVSNTEADIEVRVTADFAKAQNCFSALHIYLMELSREYPKNIKLLEV